MQLAWGRRGRGVPRRARRVPRRAHAARGAARRDFADGDDATATDAHPAVGARLAGDAVRPRLDDPRLPARARRPERHAGADARSTSRSWRAGGIPRSLHFPGYAIVAPEPARVRQRRAAGARARRDPRRHRLVHRHERAERRLRPRRPARPAPCSTATASSSTARRCGRRYAMVAAEVLLLRAHRPRRAEAQGHLLLIIDMDTPGIDVRPLRHITGAADFAEVFFTDVVVPAREPRRRAERRLAHHAWARSPTSAAGCGSRASPGSSTRVDGLVDAGAAGAAVDDDPVVRRRIAEAVRAGREPAGARLQGLRVVRPGHRRRPSTRYMKLATSELRQGALRARHGDAGRRTAR